MTAAGGIEAALERAAAACARHGTTLTELRRQVLGLVLAAEAPIGAYALLDGLRALRRGAAPPTVYRALDFLLAEGLIHRVERLNAFLPCAVNALGECHEDHEHTEPHAHPHQFLICGRCGVTAEVSDAGIAAAIARAAAAAGFAAAGQTVEIEGTCARCAAA